MNKEFLHMQKLAGLITESQYKKLIEVKEIYPNTIPDKLDLNDLPTGVISYDENGKKLYKHNKVRAIWDENGNLIFKPENITSSNIPDKLDISNNGFFLPLGVIKTEDKNFKPIYLHIVTQSKWDMNGNLISGPDWKEPGYKFNEPEKIQPHRQVDDEILDLLNLLNKKYDLIQQGDQKTIDQMDEVFDTMDFSKDLRKKFYIIDDDSTGNTIIAGNSLLISPYKEDILSQTTQMGGGMMLNAKYYSTGEMDGIKFYYIADVNN